MKDKDREFRRQAYKAARERLEEFLSTYPFTTEDLPGEIWETLEGFEAYRVSNYGRAEAPRGILKPRLNDSGHLYVTFFKDGSPQSFLLRRLVAELFIPNPEGLSEIRFRDGDKFNCRADNLFWADGRSDREYRFFDGRRYYCGDKGYWKSTDREGKFLHVAIWEAAHGKVPEGYEIHHVDFNPDNNALENLQCLTKSEHRSLHSKLRAGQPKIYDKPTVCAYCGKVFMASRSDAKYCSANCHTRWRYWQGLCHTKRICARCGKEFEAVNLQTRYCSAQCARQARLKLTDDQREEIRRLYATGDYSLSKLAAEFNVNKKTILNIIHGK